MVVVGLGPRMGVPGEFAGGCYLFPCRLPV